MKKKTISIVITAILTFSLYGCGNDKGGKTTETISELSATESATTEESITEIDTDNTQATTEATTETTTEATTQASENNNSSIVNELEEPIEYYENMYRDVLNSNYDIITGGIDNYEYSEGNSGIGEVVMSGDENVENTIGYTFVDSNNDGIVELIIGAISDEKDGKYYGQYIYSIYTYIDMPQLVLEGWSRNRCFILGDGTFYTEGSSGAMYSVFENYELISNETEVACIDYYFSKEKDETFDEYGFYHNTTGEWDITVSEELSEEDYWNIAAEYSNRTITLELTPFSAYQYSENKATSEEAAVTVEWITKEYLHESQMGNFVADSSESEVIAAITANEKIMNLKVLSLTFEDVDDVGNTIFSVEELYTYGDFEPGNPFAITLTMYGTIPSYGISYETSDGLTHYYAISESGMDGSAILVEFEKK